MTLMTQRPPISFAAKAALLVRVVSVPHEYEKRFLVRRLSVCGAILAVPDPDAACAAVRAGMVRVLEGME